MNIYELIKKLENITMDHPEINFNEVFLWMDGSYIIEDVVLESFKNVVGNPVYEIVFKVN